MSALCSNQPRRKMKKKTYQPLFIAFTILFGIILFMSSCVHSGMEECDITDKAQVRVDFDYSQTGITPSGTTIIFYPTGNTSGGEITSFSTHNSYAVVNLLPGEYAVLVINDSFTDFSNIKFRNTGDYDNVEAYVTPVSESGQTDSHLLHYSPEILVTDNLPSFVVTQAMADDANLRLQTMRSDDVPVNKVFTLRRAVARANVVLHIKDMKYIRTASSSVSGFSEGQLLASHQNNTTGVTHGVENIKLAYKDGSKTNGTITGSFNTFGLNPDIGQNYRLTFDALLIDGKTKIHKEFDISNVIKTNKDEYGITIEIELGSKDNPLIEIPKVEAEQGTSPFDPDVDDWDENEDIDIPLY